MIMKVSSGRVRKNNVYGTHVFLPFPLGFPLPNSLRKFPTYPIPTNFSQVLTRGLKHKPNRLLLSSLRSRLNLCHLFDVCRVVNS